MISACTPGTRSSDILYVYHQKERERLIQRTHPPQCLVTVIFFNCQSNVHNLYEIEKCKRIFSSRYRVYMHSTCVERSINSSSRSRHPVSGTLPHHISCPCLSTSLHYSTWYIFIIYKKDQHFHNSIYFVLGLTLKASGVWRFDKKKFKLVLDVKSR